MREKNKEVNTHSDKIHTAIHDVQIEINILQEEVERVAKIANNMREKIQHAVKKEA